VTETPNQPLAVDESKASRRQLSWLATTSLTPDPENPRKHSRPQVRAIAQSIQEFGFNNAILVDKNRRIIVGHGRYEAAKLLGLTHVPAAFLEHLSETQVKAFRIADNRLSDLSVWDDQKLAVQLKELSEPVLDFDVKLTAFDLPEVDVRIRSLDPPDSTERADEFKISTEPAVSIAGDLWLLGSHRLYHGNTLDAASWTALMGSEKAAAVFTDMPYNLRIDGHVSGNGAVTHREFAMASGEMSEPEFAEFLTASMRSICAHTTPGALIYSCMDWRHIREMLAAGATSECELINLCVWAKSNGGMGSLYRSQHELVFVFKNGKEAHLNNVQLGRFGRNRTNVWNYPGFNGFGRKDTENAAAFHPTVKPIAMVADAILDSTKRNDIVLDPYIGSGTTILAAERTGRRCFGIEIDPIYVDTTIGRWERLTGLKAKNSDGLTFEQVKLERSVTP
jgi:DNA modification methylase